jgi:asparagine synthase (glutamine-hydrolysing)
MCGFVGIVSGSDEVNPRLIEAMRDTLVHRGPDDAGIYMDRHVGLGFRRLSILDLAHGAQPMSDESETTWVVFNGEIYNYIELRNELEALGHTFKTQSDTETIVQGYRAYGTDLFKKLNGMFAIAIWDRNRNRVVLARDRAGEKPLHYCQHGDTLIFGSELKALLRHPKVTREIDWQAFDQYFSEGQVAAPRTIYRDVRKLLPGHYVVFEQGTLTERVYWQLDPEARFTGVYEDAREECLALLDDAVRIRMRSDVPLGGFLSGGVDSSAIVSLMARSASRPVKSFTVSFGESDYNESSYARMVAERWHTEHTEVNLTPDHFLEHVESVLTNFDEPFGDSSALATYLVSKITRQHVTVALSGDGADEVFGGYWNYASALKMEQRLRYVPDFVRPFARLGARTTSPRTKLGRWLRVIQMNKEDRYLGGVSLFSPQTKANKNELFSDEASASIEDERRDLSRHVELFRQFGGDPVSAMQYVDLMQYLPDDILTKVDRTSMLVSLEARAPFLDHRLIEFAFSLPREWHVTANETKRLLKDALRDLLPEQTRTRAKMGFAIPVRYWFRKGYLKPFYDHIFSPSMQRYFNMDTIHRYLREHEQEKDDHSGKLWYLLAFALWLHQSEAGEG